MTVAEIAENFAGMIGPNTDKLMVELRGQGRLEECAPGRASTLDFVSECLLFEAFPIDVIVAKELALTVRRSGSESFTSFSQR